MVYCLIFGVISLFVTNFILKRIKLKKKNKKIILVLKVVRLVSVTSALTIIAVLVFEYVGQKITEAHGDIYVIHNAEQSEYYYAQIDPALFPKEIVGGGVSGTNGTSQPNGITQPDETAQPNGIAQSDETAQPNGTAQPDETLQPNGIVQPGETSQPNGIAQSDGTSQPNETTQPRTEVIISYDFSVLMILGEHQFGEYITPEDLLDMRSMYNEYWKNEMYRDSNSIYSGDLE